MNIINRALISATFLSLTGTMVIAQTAIKVAKTNGCDSCLVWIEHLEENDFAVIGAPLCA